MPVALLDALHDGQRVGWGPALAPRREAARALQRAFQRQVEDAVRPAGRWALGRAAGVVARVVALPFRRELRDVAAALALPAGELLLANLAYELSNAAACSAFVRDGPEPLHARNLDWIFPTGHLREHAAVVRVHGAPCGDYAMVTWPGFVGALTAVAPGRFSVAVNYVRHARESRPGPFLARAARGAWPVAWLVRRALDEAAGYDEAVRLLETAPLLAPALLSVAGVHPGEGVVLERTVRGAARRPLAGGVVCVTNHYLSEPHRGANVDLAPQDTLQRMDALGGVRWPEVADAAAALRLLSGPGLLLERTQLHVAMSAAAGTLVVQPRGEAAVEVALEMLARR